MPIFISYSRSDGEFVRRLHARLAARGRETWVDWEGIPPTADWMREIHGAIDAADAVVFVLSPHSIASTVCAQELEYAAAQHKRLIPVVARAVDPAQTPALLARLNWIFSTGDDLEPALDVLLGAIDTDLDWVQAHTRLLVRSAEWDRHRREGSFALRGSDLKTAEQWLTLGPTRTPPPTELQTRYIIESRRQATRRRSVMFSGVTIALVVTAVLGTLFVLQRNEAARQQAVTTARRLASTAERQRDAALEYTTDTARADLSVQLAAEALRRVDALGLRSVEADLAIRRGLALLPVRVAKLDAEDGDTPDSLTFGRNGEIIATSSRTSATLIWTGGHRDNGVPRIAGAGTMIPSPDGRAFAVVQPDDQHGVVEVREMRTHRLLAKRQGDGAVAYAALAPDGRYMVITDNDPAVPGSYRTRLWTLPEPDNVRRLPAVIFPVFSPDGAYLAGVTGDDRLQVWSVASLASGTATPLRVLANDTPSAGRPLFSPDGTHLAMHYGDETRVRIWTVGDWNVVQDFSGGVEGFLASVAPGARALALAEAYGAGYRLFLVDGARHCRLGQIVVDSKDPVVAFSADGTVVAAGSGSGVVLFRVPARCGFSTPVEGVSHAIQAAFNAESGHLAVVSRSTSSPASGLLLHTVNSSTGQATSTTMLPPAELVAFSANGRWLALASMTQVRLVDAVDGRERARFVAPAAVRDLAVAADASVVVTVTADETVRAWRGNPLRESGAAPLSEELAPGFAAIDAQRFLAVTRTVSRIGERLSVRSWNVASMTEAGAQPVGQDRGGFAATMCGVSGDGHRIAVNARGIGVRLRDLEHGDDLGIVSEGGGEKSCTFSGDGRTVAILPDLGVWDVATQTEVSRIDAAEVERAALSHDGRYLAMVSDQGEMSIAPLFPGDLLSQACARLAANITGEDWERYVGSEPVRAVCAGID